VPPDLIRFSFSASRGPGGQNVNKLATKAELRIRVADLPLHHEALDRLRKIAPSRITKDDELIIISDEFKSQTMNRDAALERLRDLMAQAMVRPRIRRATKPTKGSKERRLTAKKRDSQIKSQRRKPTD
jgi:ribosome-associated protein